MPIPTSSTNNWLSNSSSYPGTGTTISDAGSYNTNLTVNLTGCTYDSVYKSFYFDNTAAASIYTQTYSGGFTDLANYWGQSFTWHVWIKNDKPSGQGTSICWMGTRSTSFTGFGFSKTISDFLQVDVAFGSTLTTSFNIQNGWHLISITFNSSTNQVYVYGDGTQIYSAPLTNLFASGGISANDAIYFGHSPLSGYAEYFQGSIAQSTLYTTVQSAGDVLAYYNATVGNFFKVVSSYDPIDPASYNPASPTIMLDTVGNCDLNLANLTYDSTLGTLTSTTILTDYGRSNLGTYPSVDLNEYWSASIWVKPNSTANQTIIFGMGGATIGTGGGTGYVAWLDGTGTQITHTTSDVVGETFSFSWNTSTWYNFTWTYDGVTNPASPVLKMYANGTLIRTVNWNIRDFSLNPTLSNLAYDGWFTGTLPGFLPTQGNSISKGPLKIWSKTLNSTEVTDEYNLYYDRFNIVSHYDPLDPTSYNPSIPTVMADTAGSCNLNLANLTYNATPGSLTSTTLNTDYGRSSNGVYPPLNLNNYWSASIWVKPTTTSTNLIAFAMGATASGGNGVGYYLILSGGGTSIDHSTIDATGETFAFSWNASTWYNFVITYDGFTNPGTPVLKLYSNGTLIRTVNWGIRDFSLNPSISNLPYNGWFNNSQLSSPPFFNDISKGPLTIWNSTLTATQVTNQYNLYYDRFNPPILLAEFDFGNGSYPGSGTTVYDLTANNNDLTFPNGLTYTTTYGGEATLTGSQTSNLIGSYPNNLPQGSEAHTMVLWGKYTSSYNVAMFANGGASPAGARIDLGYAFGSRLGGEIYGQGFATDLADTPAIGDWFQFVCVKPTNDPAETNADLVLYYNGNLTGTTPITGTSAIDINSSGSIPSTAPGLAINWQGASGDMAIIKAAIYSGAWTSTEVTADYADFQARISPTPPPYAGNVGGRTFGQGFAG